MGQGCAHPEVCRLCARLQTPGPGLWRPGVNVAVMEACQRVAFRPNAKEDSAQAEDEILHSQREAKGQIDQEGPEHDQERPLALSQA